MGKGILYRSYTKGKSRRAAMQGSQSKLRCAARLCFRTTTVSGVLNDIWKNIDLSIRLFADNCIVDRKITNKIDIENLQKVLNTLGNSR